jgi:hypothetical protein
LVGNNGTSHKAHAQVIEKYCKYMMEAGGGQWLKKNHVNYFIKSQKRLQLRKRNNKLLHKWKTL